MANDLLIEPETDSKEAALVLGGLGLDALTGSAFEEKSTLACLYESIRDICFPPQLPPLELTSKPIPVPDRMKVKANPWAIGIAAGINVAIVAALLFFGVKKIMQNVAPPQLKATPIEVTDFKPLVAVSSGGGGGSPDKAPVSQGHLPPRMQTVTAPPKLQQPLLPSVDVQTDIKIPDNQNLPNFGLSTAPNVKFSGGNGSGIGIGSGHGNGVGPGSGGNFGGNVYQVGNGVTRPVLLRSVDPEFSEEARRNKYQGIVEIMIIVDAQGNPQNPRIVRALGMGLDEEAIKAVMQYKFKPGTKNGKAVAVYQPIAIDFRLY